VKDNFPHWVKSLRKHLGLSQEEFSKKLDKAFATINRWKNGKCVPSRLEIKHNKSICYVGEVILNAAIVADFVKQFFHHEEHEVLYFFFVFFVVIRIPQT
jgi:transcriptional regulator with XRE-family HTH domain